MSSLKLDVTLESRELIKPFVISTGARTHQTVLNVKLSDGSFTGRGQATGLAYRGETPDRIFHQIQSLRSDIERGVTRNSLAELDLLGGSRSALDAALWEIEAARAGTDVAELIGLDDVRPIASAYTVVLDSPEAMAEQAAQEAWRPLLKVKLGGNPEDEADRMHAVAAAAPEARRVIDANAGWSPDLLRDLAPLAADLGFEFLEQPLPMGTESDGAVADALRQAAKFLPIYADESVQTIDDLKRIAPLYQGVNIKLDKCGGLTPALAMRDAARARGLSIFIGSMLAPTIAVAPAHLLAQSADYADLDGPFWFRDEPVSLDHAGRFEPISPDDWGCARPHRDV